MADESIPYSLVLGRVIASLRERLSQAQLAAVVEVAQSSLSRFETGASTPDAFRRLAAALGMTVGELQNVVDRSLAQMQLTAEQAAPGPEPGTPWWQVASGARGGRARRACGVRGRGGQQRGVKFGGAYVPTDGPMLEGRDRIGC